MKNHQRLFGLLLFSLLAIYSTQAQSAFSDCATARILCTKTSLQLAGSKNSGVIQESFLNTCFPEGFSETNSTWLKWKISEGGTLKFTILPYDETDDVDFALFRISTLDNCTESWQPVRCSAAGPNLGKEDDPAIGCTGATGLNDDAENTTQSAGCPADAINFLKPLDVLPGEYYALFINNFRSEGALALEWGGSCVFETIPEACQSTATGVTSANPGTNGFIASSLYPNPSAHEVAIAIESDRARTCDVQLISTGGQIHLAYSTDLQAGSNTVKLPVESLHPGVYFIKIKSENETQMLRFAKQ